MNTVIPGCSTLVRLLPILLLAACAPRQLRVGANSCANASADARKAWTELQAARAEPNGCQGENIGRCEQLRLRIDFIGQNCPSSQPAMLATAILAYDDRQIAKAQSMLDTLLSNFPPDPDAAALRARIAIEEGNIPYALRFLAEQIHLTGNHSGLHEVYASALYLSGDHAAAAVQMEQSLKLGTPVWRVEYALGLIAEAKQDFATARSHYETALKSRPEWALAQARVQALELRQQTR